MSDRVVPLTPRSNSSPDRSGMAAPAADTAWATIRTQLETEYGARTFDSWLKPLALVALEGSEVTLSLPTHFTCEWVRNNFLERLRGLWAAAVPGVRSVRLVVAEAPRTPPLRLAEPEDAASHTAADAGAPLEPRFSFDKFIVGASNEFAFNAARAVAEGGPVAFNPLFLHSSTGLGKTHLMHAIGLEVRARDPRARVAYMSAEKFMTDFLAALRVKDMIGFKQKLRSLDVLMIDDVQFIAGKDSTQEEFFHTMNELISSGKRLVISADRSPQDLMGVQQRITSRLAGGLVADMHPADYELRLNILHAKAAALPDVRAPRDLLDFLARRITSNVRELEGALNRVTAYAALTGQPLTLEFARQVLSDVLRAHERRITIDEIQRKTAEHYGLKMTELLSQRRAREVARPRQVAMYLAKKLTPRSLPEIGRRFGGRDHTTVMHAVKRIEELRRVDPEIASDVGQLLRVFEA
jgi:chromosomal replication initiator protein